jgi:hypothetical protein
MTVRITFTPGVMGGRACIRGMLITMALVVNLVANGMSTEEILAEYLADMGVSAGTVAALRASGHDVVHVRDIGFHERVDADILAEARKQRRVVVTLRRAA